MNVMLPRRLLTRIDAASGGKRSAWLAQAAHDALDAPRAGVAPGEWVIAQRAARTDPQGRRKEAAAKATQRDVGATKRKHASSSAAGPAPAPQPGTWQPSVSAALQTPMDQSRRRLIRRQI